MTKIVVAIGNGCGWTSNMNKTLSGKDHKAEQGLAVCYGQWFRKLAEPGKAYCIACRVELNYSN